MSEALLQAILEFPELDPPRLAYAAWCEEQGDEATKARGEFIRTQIAISQTSLEILNSGGAAGLQNRVKALLDTYGNTWAAPISPFVENYTFVRGFIGLIKLSARSLIDNAAAIFALAPVQHVDLTAVRDVSEDLFAAQQLKKLHSLSMDSCGLYDFHVRLLADSPCVIRIGWLSLANNHLDLGAAEALAESRNLKLLRFAEFRGNPVDPCEQLGFDSGVVVYAWLPPEGEKLEERYGELPWLHRGGSFSRFDY
ncbi:MAG: TIGR02996 domain-containing protein [Bryobacteraceae bacterium]|jgi:uncharacterized protein (TIGR02996 family)